MVAIRTFPAMIDRLNYLNMKSSLKIAILAVAVPTSMLSGCLSPLAGVTQPGQKQVLIAIPHTGPKAKPIPLKACVSSPDSRSLGYYRNFLLSCFEEVAVDAPDCDVLVAGDPIKSEETRWLRVREPSGADLFGVWMNFSRKPRPPTEAAAAEALKARLAPDGELFRSIPKRAGTVARSAAASAPAASGLSASDIEKLAKALRKADAPEPAADLGRILPRFAAAPHEDDLAVIVGVESYSDIGTKAPYAERDAEAVKSFIRALGVPERNIILLTGPKAVRSALTKNIEGWLPRMAKPNSRVFFYFSGHGAPDVKTGQAYLVPWDGDPNFLESTAYPVAQLYKKLGQLPAKQVLVAMDSCFSGAGGRSVLASGARPLVAKMEHSVAPAKVTVLAASGASEISGSLDDKRHGTFTYFLLEGLNAGKTTPKALADYVTPRVQDEARRLNRDQTPQLQGDGVWSLR
ncbi:MAG: caspase family protein [Elusimicrobiota bacterium]|nr:MAG: caspase family protein [Elusimicrobiota bacterium]